MGRVWRATDVVLHREVAIKELVPPPGLTPGERQEMRERSLREARAIARLNNINVVRVFDVLSTDADPWIVMEYVASRSLQDTLAQDGPFNALRAAEIGLGVLNALRAAHRNGVMHRDVKPGNVLLGADGRVVLTDFGLATVPGDPNVTRTGLVLGSPAYIAPERARDGTAGPAADLWSLGATLYAAVEGASPFARPSAIATLAALATENVPVARNAGPLKPVLNGLLRKDPAHRINAEEAERLLSRAAGRRAKITFPMSPTMRRPGAGRERPSLPSGPGGPPVLPGSGWGTATGSAPVVPNPRPPVVQPPGADGRPHFASGKAQVGGQPPETPRRGAKPLDPTRLDTPPVRDGSNPLSGTSHASPPEAGRPPRPGSDQTARPDAGRAARPGAAQPARPGAGQAPRPGAGHASVSGAGQAPVSGAGKASVSGAGKAPVSGAGQAPMSGAGQAPVSGAGQAPGSAQTPRPAQAPGSAQFGAAQTPGAGQALGDAQVPGDAQAPRPVAGQAAPAAPGSTDTPSVVAANAPTSSLRTGFTAADVAANRRKKAAPEHERSLAQATSGFPVVTPRNASDADLDAQATSVAPKEKPETPATVDDAAEAATPSTESAEPVEAVVTEPEAEATEGEATPVPEAEAQPSAPAQAEAEEQTEAGEKAAEPEVVEDKTSVVALPPPAPAEGEKTSLPLSAEGEKTSLPLPGEGEKTSLPLPAEGEKTSLLLPAEGEKTSLLLPGEGEKTSLLLPAEGEKTSLLLPAARPRPGADEDKTSVVSMPPRRRIITATEPATQVVGDPVPDPGFARPNRPAWTPMQMRPAARRTGGITILGTTLTRRQAAIGLGIILTFLLLVGIIVVQAFGDDAEKKDPTQAGAGVSAPAQPGGGKSEGPKSESPKPSPSKPSPSPSSASTEIPAGWRLYQGRGFRFWVPESVSGGGGATGTTLDWGSGRQIRIDIVGGKSDPVDYLNDDRSTGYDKIGPRRITFKGMPAAEMEYTRSASGGTTQHVVRRVFNVKDETYVLTWYTESSDWEAAKADRDRVFEGFEAK
ncbi:serine/threonine protein kinase [Actinoplanes xinjiangensis]|uniref:Serine/threonine protein kinase n=1 Tax=Actinoplanes xinjiangensis TaxID=512350 RepID=A0A316EPN3_9ACTN|nr:serine/threonine protein kinase [Actinoplanes xinjiangensis]GIF43112.1 hypothetical protein Axi01nite_74230 [Actinoplanes xinjiangensis]